MPESTDFIEGISPNGLEVAIHAGAMDHRSQILLAEEQSCIKKRREKAGYSPNQAESEGLVGLGLSGGGIRSATFCLGVMQALAKGKLFKYIDYLSTVSGGGYIGSAVTWLKSPQSDTKNTKHFEHPEDFPFGTGDEKITGENEGEKAKLLKFLRGHGNYLAPGGGISHRSMVAVFLRGTVLTVLVWFLLFLAMMLTIISWSKRWVMDPSIKAMLGCQSETAVALDGAGMGGITPLCHLTNHTISASILILGGAVVAIFLLLCVAYSIISWFSGRVTRKFPMSLGRWNRYFWRRGYEKTIGKLLSLAIVLLVLGSLPLKDYFVDEGVALSGFILGILGGVWSYFKTGSEKESKIPLGVIATLGSILVIYGIMLLSFLLADDIVNKWSHVLPNGPQSPLTLFGYPLLVRESFELTIFDSSFTVKHLIWSLTGLGFILGAFVNLNYISIHRYYRDRLMESFMPDIESALDDKTGPAKGADRASLDSIQTKEDIRSPYHIVNTNLVLVDSENKTYRNRGGDNFILSPLYCGSNATGWRNTKYFMKGNMKLSSAMAISGAAANPNTGVGGKGVTRNPAVSVLMALLNIRLGYWVPNPNPKKSPFYPPNHFIPGLFEIWADGYQANRRFLQLSDGGHFENNAMYELVRRRCKLIIICDVGYDKEFSFSTFQTTLKRIENDFGVRVDFDDKNQFDELIPTNVSSYPVNTKTATRGFIEGTITYSHGTRRDKNNRTSDDWKDEGKGKLVFIKTTMIKDVDFEVKGYKSSHPDFPDETTADQFFSEEQFEAYRKLGFQIGEDMIKGVRLEDRIHEILGIKNSKVQNIKSASKLSAIQ